MPTLSPPVAILFSLFHAGARGRRGRVPANRLPPAVVLHPNVAEHDAILDYAPKIFEPPPRLDRADRHIVENGRVLDFDGNVVYIKPLEGVEPLLASHDERPGGAGADEHEILVEHGFAPIHVLSAKRIAPIALELFDQLAVAV